MLKNETVASFLTAQFKAQDPTNQLRFIVHPDVHCVEACYFSQGILVATQSRGEPLPLGNGYVARNYSYFISFAVLNKAVCTMGKAFNKAITDSIALMQGKSFDLDGGQAVFTFEVPHSQGAGWIEGGGEGAIHTLNFSVLFTENATTTSNKVWLLDGVELPYLDESIELEKQGATNSVFGLKATQSLPIKQTKFYRFTLPFDNTSEVLTKIQRDMFEGDMTKIYTLSYYDGISYTQDKPYTTTVSLFRTASSGASRPGVSNFTVAFTDVDNGSSGPTLYEMALIDNQFDDGSINVRWFPSRSEQEAWFADKIAVGAPYSAIKAPNLNSLTITQQVYFVSENASHDLNDMLTKNYAIIRATDRASGALQQYYYYFIQSASVGSNNQILVDLKMDTIQTYYFDPNIQIPDCIINRAHLNRWVDLGNGAVGFDNTLDSPLFEREQYQNLPTRLIKKTPLYLCIDLNSNFDYTSLFNLSPLDKWLKDNVKNWVYVYMLPEPISSTNPQSKYETLFIEKNDIGINCFCYPVYKMERYIELFVDKPTGTLTPVWNSNAFWNHIKESNGSSRIISVKVSARPPFEQASYVNGEDYAVLENSQFLQIFNCNAVSPGNTAQGKTGGVTFYYRKGTAENPKDFACYYQVISDTKAFFSEPFNLTKKVTFNVKKVIEDNNNITYNPKLLSSDYFQLALASADGQRFDYDAQKLSPRDDRLEYTEILTPDITRGYLRFQTFGDEIYSENCRNNFTGLVYSSDNSYIFSTTAWDAFISNNKNQFQQAQMLKDYSLKQADLGILNSGLGLIQKKPLEIASSILGFGSSLLGKEGVNIQYKNQMLTLDNMKAAPNSLKNANGNSYFVDAVTGMQLFINEYDSLFQEKKEANDYMNLNGFSYNRLGNIKSFDNIRHYFNYVQAEMESILGVTMSNDARNNLRQRFAAGIRFWKGDNIEFVKENYEEWLEDISS